MRKFTFFLAMMVAMVTTSFAQTPVLELSAEQIGTYPYQLNEEDAAKVFALTDLTVAVKINTVGVSGRRGLFVTSDPTKAKNTAAEGTASRYVSYGLNDSNISYLASWRSGDRFSGSAKFTTNSEVVCVYVINPTNGKCELYFNGTLDRSWSGTNPNGFMTAYEIATPAMVKGNHPNANIYIGGGVSSEGASETFDGTIEGVKVYSGALSAAEIAAINFEDPALLAEARAAYNAAQAAAQAILDEAELNVKKTELPLQANNENEPYYLWCNKPEYSEGSINALFDGGVGVQGGKTDFFHTNWSDGNEQPRYHYIEVDLGNNNAIKEFTFGYNTRNNNGIDFPDKIYVLGSNDKNGEYTQIYSVESGLPQGAALRWDSEIISLETAYRYIRFNVDAERTYWHMSEFDMYTNEISIAEKYAAVANEVATLKSICDSYADNATYGIAKLNAAAAAINAAVEAINAGVNVEPEVPFEVVAVTPTEAVAELTTVTVEFSEEIEGTFDMMGMTQIYLGTRSNGCSFEVNGKVLTITPFNAINTPGEYKLVIPAGLITRKSNGEAVTMNGEYVFTVKEAEAPFEVVAVTPTEAVAELTTVTVEFSEEIEGTFDMMGMTQIYLGTRSNGCSFEVNGKVLTITPFNAINTPGEYKLVIPAGLITRKSNGEAVTMNGEYVFTVKEAEAPFEVVAVTPTEAVAELTTVTVEFSEEIEGTFDMMGMTQIYLGTRSNGCSFEVNGKVLTITPFNAINTPGEYKLVIPAGLITRKSNGEAVTMNGEYVFTVKEAEAPFEVVAVTPTEAVAELTTVTVEFSEEIEGTFDMMGMTQIYLGTRSNGCSFEVNGKVLTITPFNAINTPGEYKLVIPAGLITRKSNGEAVTMNGEYVFTVKEAEAPFEVVAVTPTEAVAELTTVTVEFSEEIEGTFDMMGMTQIYLGTRSNGCSFEVNGKVLTITPFNAINTPGEYKLVIPAGLITRKSNGEAVTMNGEYVFTVKEAEAPFEVVAVTPTEAVAELTTVTVEFSEEIEGTFDMMGMTQIYLGTRSNGCSFEVNGKVLTITPFNAINTPGEYKLVIPAGLITRKSNGEAVTMNGEYVFTVKEAEAPFEVVAVTPTEAVAELTTVTVEFSEEIEGTFDMMGMTQIYLGTRSNGCSFEVNGKVLTITPFNAINTPGEYKLVIPAGLITRKSNGEAVTMNGEYVFTVKEAVVEPETPTLNETVIFDFTNGEWGIPTMEQNNFSNIKTAGEYTDGAKTINIDPTANGGSYIYDSKGFLQLGKPGSKITLPAFDFAVEKIEVVGHSSATSYPNVDMNVFVGGNAVSTACIGTTATSTFEIAADNQAAGNVYELVIGSNGGNYSSVMYITYIKVYPAENKLEAPVIDLESGVYVGAQAVNVHSATADLEGVTNVTYYYTTDGNEPTVEDEEAANGEITIENSCTLKVIVELTYGDKTYVSASASAEYIITEAVTYHRAVAVESGNYFLVADGNVATPIKANGKTLPAKETTVNGDDVTEGAYYALTLEESENGFNIKDFNGKYIYTSIMNTDRILSGTMPMDSWTITIADDETSAATITSNDLVLVFVDGQFVVAEATAVPENAVYPTFYGVHATGVENIITNGEAIESIFDLNGRKIEKITESGIYIVNGKKTYVK